MDCEINVLGNLMTAVLDGEIDHHSARSVREQIDYEIDLNFPKDLILDFTGVTFMDSSGIGLIMGRYKKLKSLSGQLHIQNPSPNIYRVLRLAGMDRLAKIERSEKNDDCCKSV